VPDGRPFSVNVTLSFVPTDESPIIPLAVAGLDAGWKESYGPAGMAPKIDRTMARASTTANPLMNFFPLLFICSSILILGFY
jgi:hypothetical protein